MQILVHTITKFYYSSPSCCREMQGDAKLHHPLPGMGCSETPPPGIGLKIVPFLVVRQTLCCCDEGDMQPYFAGNKSLGRFGIIDCDLM